MFTIQISYYSI